MSDRHISSSDDHQKDAVLTDAAIMLALAMPAVIPLASQGFLWGDDYEDPPWRSLELVRALSEGILYPRWSADLYCGYGFPLFNFYAPLSHYPAAILKLISPIGYLDGSKVTFGLALAASGVGAYLLARQLLKHRGAALLAGILYLYSPAIIGEVYVRSTISGAVSLALIPWVLYSFALLLERPSLAGSGATGLLLGMLILSHNINCAIGLGMMALMAIFHIRAERGLRSLPMAVLAMALGLTLSAFFWAPAAAEMGMTHGVSYDMRAHFVDPLGGDQGIYGAKNYLQTSWGPFDLHPAYPYGLPPWKFGLIQAVLLLAGGIALLLNKKRPAAVMGLYTAVLLLFYGHTTWSLWLWKAVPAAELMQFPWRLIRPAGLGVAVAGSWAVLQATHRWRGWVMAAIAAASILSAMWLAPTDMRPFPFGPIAPEGLVKWQLIAWNRFGTQLSGQFLPQSVQWKGMSELSLLNRYGQVFPDERWVNDTAFLPKGARAWILATRRGQNWFEAKVEAAENSTIAFKTIYFAGWTAYLDGKRVEVTPSSWTEFEEQRRAALGVCQVDVPEGTHVVTLVFEDTPIRAAADWLSIAGVAVVGVLLLAPFWSARRRRRRIRLLLTLAAVSLALAGAHYLLREAVASNRAQAWASNGVVFDLLTDAQERKLQVSTPAGRLPEEFVLQKSFTIQGESRPVLYMHPPGSVAASGVWLPKGAKLEYTVAIDPEVWDKNPDGVVFQVTIREGESATPVLERHVDPRSVAADRGWVSGEVDLSRFEQREVEVELSTRSGDSADYDWAGWATARIVID